MMKYLLMFVATVAIASAQPRMNFALVGGGSSGSYYERGNMTITCTEQPSTVGRLLSLGLKRLRGTSTTEELVFNLFGETSSDQEKSTNSRYSVDQRSLTFTGSGGKFVFTIQTLDCTADSAQYWCVATGGSGAKDSQRQNLSIAAAPNNMRMENTYERCVDISFGDNQLDCQQQGCPAMARYGAVSTFDCSVSVSAANSAQYRFTWYRKKAGFEDVLITERNVTTESTYDRNRNYGACDTVSIRSKLTYSPQANDHNLELECRLTGTSGDQYGKYNESVKVCVTGLEPEMLSTESGLSTTPAPDSDADTGGGTSDAGMIAGIIIGVIALIVLVVLLVYFLWYRRRDEGETYNTKDENAMSSDPEKPENTQNAYDGNNFRQGRPRGYVSRHVDEDDDDSIKKPPPYGKDNPALDDDDFDNDVEVKPRATYHTGHQNPIGSAV